MHITGALVALAVLAAAQETKQDAHAAFGSFELQIPNLSSPAGCAFGPDGSLYVVESVAARVRVFDPKGTELRTFGTRGFGDKDLLDPRDVAVSAEGEVFVCDAGNHQVHVFDAKGALSRRFGGYGAFMPGSKKILFNDPEGLAVSGDRLAVADTRNDRVVILDLQGKLIREIGSGWGSGNGEFNRPLDVTFDAAGNLYVSDSFNQRIQKFSAEGKFLLAWGDAGPNPGQLASPSGIEWHAGALYVADRDNSRIQVFDESGKLLSWWGIHALRPREGEGKLHYPVRIAISPDGERAALAEEVEDRVQVFGPRKPDEPVQVPMDALPPSHYGGSIDAAGPLLAVTEPSIPKIILFQKIRGEPIEIGNFAVYGRKPGQMLWPSDIAIDVERRRLYVADTGNLRLSAYSFRFDPNEDYHFDPDRIRFEACLDFTSASLPQPEVYTPDQHWMVVEPQGIWLADGGRVFIADARNRLVWRVMPDLTLSLVQSDYRSFLRPVDGTQGKAIEVVEHPTDVPQPAPGTLMRHEQWVVDELAGAITSLSGEIREPRGLRAGGACCFPSGEPWFFTDWAAHALLGKRTIGKPGASGLGALEFFKPKGIAIDGDGLIVVLDWGNHRGVYLTPDGKFVHAFGSRLFIKPAFEGTPKPLVVTPADPKAVRVPDAPPAPQLPKLDGTKSWHSAKAIASNAGTYAVFWKADPATIPERKDFALDVWVTALAEPNTLRGDVALSVDAGMPEHGHGMTQVPAIERKDDGRFRVTGMRFHMPGRWELYFEIVRGAVTERAQVTIELE